MDQSEAGRIRNLLTRRCPGQPIAPWPQAPADLPPPTTTPPPPPPPPAAPPPPPPAPRAAGLVAASAQGAAAIGTRPMLTLRRVTSHPPELGVNDRRHHRTIRRRRCVVGLVAALVGVLAAAMVAHWGWIAVGAVCIVSIV